MALSSRWREHLSLEPYRALARKVKYPLGSMLVSQTLFTFAGTAVLARWLGEREFGHYSVLLTVVWLFGVIAMFPVEFSIPRFIAEARHGGRTEGDDVRGWYGAGLCCRVAASVLAFAACTALARPVAALYHIGHLRHSLLLLAAAMLAFMPTSQYFLGVIQGFERPRRWAGANLGQTALVFPAMAAGAFAFRATGMVGLTGAIAGAWLLATTVTACFARAPLGRLWVASYDREKMRALLLFLLPMWVANLAGQSTLTIIRTLLAMQRGAEEVGHFTVAHTLLTQLMTLYSAAVVPLMPEWARLYVGRQGQALLASMLEARKALVGLAGLYGLGLVAGSGWFVPLLFGSEQAPAVPACRVMGLCAAPMIAAWVTGVPHVLTRRTHVIAAANLLWAALAAGAASLLCARWGAAGAAWALCGAYVCFLGFYAAAGAPFFRAVGRWEPQLPQASASTSATS